MMTFKERLISKMREEFFPFTTEERLISKISDFFYSGVLEPSSIIVNKKKMGFTELSLTGRISSNELLINLGLEITFLIKSSELFILIVSGSNDANKSKFQSNVGSFNSFVSDINNSTKTKIVVLASEEWNLLNKEFLEVIDFISMHKKNMYMEEKLLGIDIPDNVSSSYIFTYLNREPVRHNMIKNIGTKTKYNFYQGVITYLANSIKTRKISELNFKDDKVKIYDRIAHRMISSAGRSVMISKMSDMKSFFNSNLIPILFKRCKYNKMEWNIFFMDQIIPTLKEDLKVAIFNITQLPDINKYHRDFFRVDPILIHKFLEELMKLIDDIDIDRLFSLNTQRIDVGIFNITHLPKLKQAPIKRSEQNNNIP